MRDKRLPRGQCCQYRGIYGPGIVVIYPTLAWLRAANPYHPTGWQPRLRGRYAIARASFTAAHNRCGRGSITA